MDTKQTPPELSQAELLPTQEEQVPANPPSRKRPLDSDDDAEPRAKRARATRPTSEPARLTRQNLARFNKMGKHNKKTSKVPTAASDFPSTSGSSSSAKTLSTTASGFADQAYKNGILPPLNSKPPANLQEIRERLDEARATASPPGSVYEGYVRTVGMAPNEATMVVKTSGRLLKEYDDEGYDQAFNQAFTGFPANVGFNNGLSAPQPDFVEGLRKREYAPFPVEERVSGAVLYKDNPYSLTLPHLAGEWKGPGGDMREATLQGSYDGAALVYARNRALAYQGKSDPPGHASVTTFTTNGTQINFFAHYVAETEDGTLEYHQFPVKSTSLVNSHGEHKEGRRELRNAQDHAREQSYALKDQLQEYYKQQRHGGLYPVATGVPTLPVPGIEPLDAYEDEGDYEVIKLQPIYQPTPPTSL
ncbi:hypothetical protein QBC35DRAFT_218189 [Podospora australis]|uniref:Uncharacterized protein n=1 Tax=Podospora australis TaxID=1536484 RepID=A0AAN7ADN8_9PEZI|nr:hypothetical protein QBC35DRAFT_218189 [Podospora australis]